MPKVGSPLKFIKNTKFNFKEMIELYSPIKINKFDKDESGSNYEHQINIIESQA